MIEKENEKSPSRPAQITVILRLVAGAYLLYLAFGLFGEVMKSAGGRQLLQIGSMVLFAAVGAILSGWSLKKLIKGEYIHPGEDLDENPDENSDEEENK